MLACDPVLPTSFQPIERLEPPLLFQHYQETRDLPEDEFELILMSDGPHKGVVSDGEVGGGGAGHENKKPPSSSSTVPFFSQGYNNAPGLAATNQETHQLPMAYDPSTTRYSSRNQTSRPQDFAITSASAFVDPNAPLRTTTTVAAAAAASAQVADGGGSHANRTNRPSDWLQQQLMQQHITPNPIGPYNSVSSIHSTNVTNNSWFTDPSMVESIRSVFQDPFHQQEQQPRLDQQQQPQLLAQPSSLPGQPSMMLPHFDATQSKGSAAPLHPAWHQEALPNFDDELRKLTHQRPSFPPERIDGPRSSLLGRAKIEETKQQHPPQRTARDTGRRTRAANIPSPSPASVVSGDPPVPASVVAAALVRQQPTSEMIAAAAIPSSYQTAWESHFADLLEFKKKHGHCRVPDRFPENPTLAGWVRRQRSEYQSDQNALLHMQESPSPGAGMSISDWSTVTTTLPMFFRWDMKRNAPTTSSIGNSVMFKGW